MRVEFHKYFEKQFKKLPRKIQAQFNERLLLLISDPSHPLLRVHQLNGEKYPCKSMNVNADYRALFINTDDCLKFFEIGSHSELYEK
jgi:addiction module RelE/StbE family toxin